MGDLAEVFFSQTVSYLSIERRHAGESGARRGLRHDWGRMRRGRKIGRRELLEKRWGTNASLYLAKDWAGR
jgi:hypothetical protein